MRTSNVFLLGAVLAALVLVLGLRAADKPPPKDEKNPPAKLEPKEMPGTTSITEIEGKDLKRWIAETKDEDPSVREKAIRAIIAFGPQASTREVILALVDRCTDVEASPRVRAVIALTVLDIQETERTKVIEALAKRLEGHFDSINSRWVFDDPQGIVRYHAAIALNRFGEEAKSAIPQLVVATKDVSSFETRRAAVLALRKIGRDAKNGPDNRATSAMLDRLKAGAEPAVDVKLEAIISLGVMGRPADPQQLTTIENTLKNISQNSNSRDAILCIWAHYGLMAHMKDGEVSEPHLMGIAKHATSPDVVTRVHTAQALGTIGSKAKSQVDVVIKMLQDKDGDVFIAACMALANMGEPGDAKAFRALFEMAEAKDDADPKPDRTRKDWAKYAIDAMKNKDKEKMDEKKDKDGKKDK
jgi:HEAT repeat protein